MHPQLEILLELQDLKAQKREIEEAAEEHTREIESEVFQVKPENAVAHLEDKIDEMEETLEPEVLKRYRLIADRRPRAVVPVLSGMCYGCFMEMPTSMIKTNDEIRWCEHCGSFVYFVD
jgi:predicted  nucleic acid-binding Zn-ribbon protein